MEPVHVHVAEGKPTPNGTKIWLAKSGGVLLGANTAKIPKNQLQIIMEVIKARRMEIETLWLKKIGEISYYC